MLKSQQKSNLISIQKELLKQIFTKNDNTWKIIIFDQFNRDIISSIYKMKDFRQNNITLYFNIKQYREQLHGVTAIYLLKPTIQNVELILKDFQNDLYSSTIIHFSSQPPVHLLSSFAKNLAKKKPSALSRVSKVQYSNIGFQIMDNKMAILPENTQIINFLLTFKCQPIFVHSNKDQEQVNFIKQRIYGSLFGKDDINLDENEVIKNKNYVLVFFFNRQLDMFPVFAHGITYAGLMQDIWKFSKNGSQLFQTKQQQAKGHGIQIDLNDQIWVQRKNMHTNEMELQKQFNKIKTRMLSVNNKIDQFTQLSQKNKKIQWHLSNVENLIRQAKKRVLNQFHSVQEELYTKKQLSGDNKKCFVQLLKEAKDQQDKCRLMLCYLSCVQNIQKSQVQQLQSYFPDVKKNNTYNQLKLRRLKQDSSPSDSINQSSKYLKKFAKGIWKNLVSSQKKYLLVKYLQKIQQFDQKTLSDLGLKMTTMKKVPHDFRIQKIIAHVSGGVCFNEYANLATYDPNIYYTGDKITNYRQFF